jgi:hypothetical protein
MIVVKVGGSLFDHPALGSELRAFVESLAPAEVLLVAGGGPVADAVRELDRVHGLGEEAAHWLALRALDVTAELMERMMRNEEDPSVPALSISVLKPTPPSLKGGGEKEPTAAAFSPLSVSDPTPRPPPPGGEGEEDTTELGCLLRSCGANSPSPPGGGGRGVGSETDNGRRAERTCRSTTRAIPRNPCSPVPRISR